MNEENQNLRDNSGYEEAIRLRYKMSLVQDYVDRRLPDKELAFFEQNFLGSLQESTEKEWTSFLGMWTGMCIAGFVVGLRPSDCYADRLRIYKYFIQYAASERPSSAKRPGIGILSDATMDSQNENSIVSFWKACFLFSFLLPNNLKFLAKESLSVLGNEILGDLDKALQDSQLPRKMRFAALILRANCNVFMAEYEEAIETLETLQIDLRLDFSKNNIQRWIGYVSSFLRHQRFYNELDKPIYVEIPDEEFQVSSSGLLNNRSILIMRQILFMARRHLLRQSSN